MLTQILTYKSVTNRTILMTNVDKSIKLHRYPRVFPRSLRHSLSVPIELGDEGWLLSGVFILGCSLGFSTAVCLVGSSVVGIGTYYS